MKKISLLFFLLFVFHLSFAQEKAALKWWNPAQNEFPVVTNQAWPNEVQSVYQRLPKRAENSVRKTVWKLSKQSAGLSIRFWSNADSIHIKYSLAGGLNMSHMPSTGVSGLDLYSKSRNGEWLRCWGSYSIDTLSTYKFIIDESSEYYRKYGREYQLLLPLYNEVDTLEIGIAQTSFLNPLPLRKERPIVAYGTSITQGACASRPGMAWTSILERKLDRSVINLGFSGNGKLEPEVIDLMTEIDAKLYILDCLPNLFPVKDDSYTLTLNAVKKLKEKRPTIPIILTAHIGYADALTNERRRREVFILNKELDSAYNTLKEEGYTGIFILKKEDLALNFDMYVDYIHPNDYGMVQYSIAYENIIRKIFNQAKGSFSTTVPVTQSRDISVYKWEERHQKILDMNANNPPKICLLGNSIVHFWGGEPESKIQGGKDSWDNILNPLGVRNFGFGWDRIENVLWRVHHDELKGFEAEQIVLMIGTNNIHINSNNEIIKGLEVLIKAIRNHQPKSRFHLIGILPRRGEEELINRLNLKIAELAELESINFKDIGIPFLGENGLINESLFTDGLHPNKKGYKLLAQELRRIIK